MRCRNIVDGKIVWFDSVGKDTETGNAIRAQSIVTQQEGVRASLTERLQVLKGELWYNVSYGVPLFDKVKSKTQMDMFVIKTMTEHPDVTAITNFESSISHNTYSCSAIVVTKFGTLDLNI